MWHNFKNLLSIISPVTRVGHGGVCLVIQSCLTLCDPMDCSLPGSSVHGDSPCKNTGVGCMPSSGLDLPNPGIEPRSPVLHVDSLPAEPQGSRKGCLRGKENLEIKKVGRGNSLSELEKTIK